MKGFRGFIISLMLVLACAFAGCGNTDVNTDTLNISEALEAESADGSADEDIIDEKFEEGNEEAADEIEEEEAASTDADSFDLSAIPEYDGSAYVVVNNNTPFFADDEITPSSYESYSSLDNLGRCQVATACIGQDIMPTESRGSIGSVKPTGWHTVKYDCVSGNYLYNRCHLIAFELAGENANEKNLITGTRYMNVSGMLPFENMVTDFVKETGYHVMYRVTPIFEGDNLVASGVLMEALSVEDNGEGIEFCVYCYDVQPGIVIDYATGDSYEEETSAQTQTEAASDDSESVSQTTDTGSTETYILNTNSMKFHYSSCYSVNKISDSNKQEYTGSREELINQGYSSCGNCNP